MPSIKIGSRLLSDCSDPYIIAEVGVNHEGSLLLAKKLIELAHEGGAQAVKFQSYKAETLASKYSPPYWDTTKEPTRSQYELFQKFDALGASDYRELAAYCERVGIDFISTPFDADAVEFLAPLIPCFKIASADLTNVPLLRQIARHSKPILLSTGASTLQEIDTAMQELFHAGSTVVAVLHCVLNYPTDLENARLGMITGLRRAFPGLVVGYSDHTLPDDEMLALTTSYLLGARIIEKHFTHDKTLVGNDHYHAMDVNDLKVLRTHIARVRALLGPSDLKEPLPSEESARQNARRSIVLRQRLDAGSVLEEALLIPKRPGTGISPIHWDEVIGKKVVRPLEADHVLQWADIAE